MWGNIGSVLERALSGLETEGWAEGDRVVWVKSSLCGTLGARMMLFSV